MTFDIYILQLYQALRLLLELSRKNINLKVKIQFSVFNITRVAQAFIFWTTRGVVIQNILQCVLRSDSYQLIRG